MTAIMSRRALWIVLSVLGALLVLVYFAPYTLVPG